MVALRKDVKVGLTIGAIVVSVVGVYAGLSALAGDSKPAGQDGTANLQTSPPAGSVKGDPAKPIVTNRDVAVAKPPTKSGPSLAGNTGSGNAPTTPTNAGSTGLANAPVSPATPSDDPWAAAFGTGVVRQPSVTVQPEPGKAAVAADRADTIRSINAPANSPADNANKQAVATASDSSSGSMNTGNPKPELTRGPAGLPPADATGEPRRTPNAGTVTLPPPDVSNITSGSAARTHTIAAGDTFSSIADEYYGDSRHFQRIVDANPGIDPGRLKLGAVVQVPAAPTTRPSSANAAEMTLDAKSQYVVKSGDSLNRIASKLWGDSAIATELYEANKALIGPDAAKLKVGMVLSLPKPPTE